LRYRGAVLRANHAVRLGLRAASRNPELSFAQALIDQFGHLLALLPLILGGVLLAASASGAALRAAALGLRAAARLGWPVLGACAAALLIGFTASMFFWSGAIPLLAADAELDRRPPSGNFAMLLSRGCARTLGAGALAWGISLLFDLACLTALLMAVPAILLRPSAALVVVTALIGATAVLGGLLVDVLARLALVRAAAFADGPARAFARAASLLGERLGVVVIVTVAFTFLDLIVATAAATLTGTLSGASLFDPAVEALALAPRAAVALAAGVVFGWLEVARMGALAAIAADAEGLIEPPAEPAPPPVAELVVDALPVSEE
jgi:hypothetical protein